MDRIARFRQKIVAVMNDYAAGRTQSRSYEGLRFEQVLDEKNNRFQLLLIGWQNGERIYDLIFHADIIDDKIWIQEDWNEFSIAEALVEKGVSKKDIVLAYMPDFHRVHTEFAAA